MFLLKVVVVFKIFKVINLVLNVFLFKRSFINKINNYSFLYSFFLSPILKVQFLMMGNRSHYELYINNLKIFNAVLSFSTPKRFTVLM